MILKSEKGFSLIELMIAASVLSFIIYITTSLINNQMDNLKVFENKISLISLEKDLTLLTTEPAICNTALTFPISFSDPDSSIINNIEIKDRYGNLFVSPNNASPKNQYDKLKVQSIILTNPNNIPANNSGMADLIVSVKAINSSYNHPSIRLSLEVTLNAAGNVISCGGGTDDWSNMPSGTHCGVFMQTGGVIRSQKECQGHNPRSSCPAGFTRADLGYFEAGGGARQYATCIKD